MPAVDGFGDPQLSWIVEGGGKRIIHCGDTLFHASWWRIARRFGPFDVAFLPINGATVDFPFLQPPRDQEAVMTPEEAIKAARMLGARSVTPIHHGSLHRPPGYVQTMNSLARLRDAAVASDVPLTFMQPSEWRSVV